MKLQHIKVVTLAATLLTFGSLAGEANGAVLTFDIAGIGNFDNVAQNYGDRITATTIGNFSYGAAEGLTPNVEIDYGSTDPSLWTTGYGDLTNVLFENVDNTGFLTITLMADPGFEVILHSFDVASFSSSDDTIDLVGVGDAPLSSSLFGETNAIISATTSTAYDFLTPLQASEVVITIDSRNIGSSNDNIGIDNITFSQVAIPEPSSALLLVFGGLGIIGRRRKLAM